MNGTLYLIPSPLGESALDAILPPATLALIRRLDTFVVEHPKTARAFLKQTGAALPLQQLTLLELNEHTRGSELDALLAPLLAGKDVGLISEAGAPAVADPGASLARLAHGKGIRVTPIVGPSAILLALMASGLNGQRFVFHGYLPVDKAARASRLRELENASRQQDETQIFIETPYRNPQLFDAIMKTCSPATLLCLATDVTLASEQIQMRSVSEWKQRPPAIDKRPTVFLLLGK